MTTPFAVELQHVSKLFGGVPAVDDVSFTLEAGQVLVMVGASGCGKTTTLRLIAGLETPDRGVIRLNGQQAAGEGAWLPPEQRRIGMVFQDYALFPHLTAAENVVFPLNGLPAAQRRARVAEMLTVVNLPHAGARYPHQLSGGEQQRVALARALAPRPGLVLLDEPFSNLDAALRKEMRDEVRRILRAVGATAIFVTHDQEEALSIADRVAILRGGRILQLAAPHDVYLRPANREVAAFLGDVNFLRGVASAGVVECALGRLPTSGPAFGRVDVMVRPETIKLEPNEKGSASIRSVSFFGHDQIVELELKDQTTIQARTWARADLHAGQRVEVRVMGSVITFPG